MMDEFLHIVGARPNFMKMDPVYRELRKRGRSQRIVHTGQHFDEAMSNVFFEQLGLPKPDVNLGIGSGSHATQTAAALCGIEKELVKRTPSMVIVYGDVNSTVSATLAAAKMGVPIAHVEAGLRSYHSSMPEEINRVITDRVASLLLCPSEDACENLRNEGVREESIRLVGNVMIDTLVRLLPQRKRTILPFDLSNSYVAVTLHRPSNVDDDERMLEIIGALRTLSKCLPVVFPVHPRTRKRLANLGVSEIEGVTMLEPMGYLEFIGLTSNARVVLTDSGGIQEETTYLGIPCITLRPNTERPVTITNGTNTLFTGTLSELPDLVMDRALESVAKTCSIIGWDGHAGVRVADALESVV